MPRTIERTVFKFAELSDSAKETAREKWRGTNQHDDWWDGVYEDAVECGRLMGISIGTRPVKLHGGGTRHDPDINFSGFSSQGDGACFAGRVVCVDDPVAAILGHAGQDGELKSIAEGLAMLQVTARLKNGGQLLGTVTNSGHYHHSGTMSCTAEYVEADGDDEPGEQVEKALTTLVRRFADWIYDRLEAEDGYLNSDECIDEQLSNDHEFDEDGDMI